MSFYSALTRKRGREQDNDHHISLQTCDIFLYIFLLFVCVGLGYSRLFDIVLICSAIQHFDVYDE